VTKTGNISKFNKITTFLVVIELLYNVRPDGARDAEEDESIDDLTPGVREHSRIVRILLGCDDRNSGSGTTLTSRDDVIDVMS